MGVDVWVFAFDFVDSLAEVSDKLLLVPVIEEDAGKCSEWWLRDGCTGVGVGVEFELGNTVQQEPAQQVSTSSSKLSTLQTSSRRTLFPLAT